MHISFEAFTKDPFLVSCRSPPQIEALSCIFQVTTNRCMGELVRQEAQSYIQFFSSCLPFKPNSEDETPSSRLPSNTRRGKDKPQRTFFAFLCVDFSVGQRGRGPDKRAALPLSLCQPARHWNNGDTGDNDHSGVSGYSVDLGDSGGYGESG